MGILQIRKEAAERLQKDGNSFRRLVLIHTGITAGVSVLLMLVTWLSQSIAPEGGLQHMDTQTLLTTAQTILRLAAIIAVPFWDAGLIYCALRMIRNRDNRFSTLTEGFSRWSPITGSLFFRGIIYFVTAMACSTATSILLSLLPLPPSVYQELTAFAEQPSLPLDGSVLFLGVIYLVIYAAGLCVLLLPTVYLHRLVLHRIMDDEPCGGLQAVIHSRLMMRGQRWKLVRLDLSFWWFYLLELLISCISMGDLILTELGVTLPVSADVAAWVFPLAGLVCQVALYALAKPGISLSYALFYQSAFDAAAHTPKPTAPKRMPWKY